MEKEKFNRVIVKNLSKDFKIGFKKSQSTLQRIVSVFSGREPKRILKVLRDISFSVESGEVLGIIGENGSGKSTLLRIVAGIYKKDGGIIKTKGKIIPLINLRAALRERLAMKDNIYFLCSLLGLSKGEIKKRFDAIVSFAGLERFVKTKVYQFSDGMKQRLVFSIAIHCNPEILLFDEVFAGGDEDFRNKSSAVIKKLIKNGCSALLVSHNLDLIKYNCNRTLLMEDGKIVKQGNSKEIIRGYVEKIRKIKQMQNKK